MELDGFFDAGMLLQALKGDSDPTSSAPAPNNQGDDHASGTNQDNPSTLPNKGDEDLVVDGDVDVDSSPTRNHTSRRSVGKKLTLSDY